MIDSQVVLYSSGANDECYTPDYGVKPIIKYIPKDKIVWCPFDTEDSEYVKQLKANGLSKLNALSNIFLLFVKGGLETIISHCSLGSYV